MLGEESVVRARPASVIAALALAIVSSPAPATHLYDCSGTWRTTQPGKPVECQLRLSGLPVKVAASAIGPGAWVHVRIEIPTFADVVLMECRATDADPGPVDHVAECEAPAASQPNLVVPLPEIAVRCRVEGKTSPPPAAAGDYFCQTGIFGVPGS